MPRRSPNILCLGAGSGGLSSSGAAAASRALVRFGRRAVLAVSALGLGLAACDTYLAPPGDGAAEAPVLENVVLSPASLNVVDAAGDITTRVDARTRSGIDGVSVVLKSPSGNGRLSCDMTAPAEGDALNGTWACDLTVVQGAESGLWVPDSIGLFSSGADGGVRYFTRTDLSDAGYQVEVEIVSEPPVPTELAVEPESAELPSADSQLALTARVLDQYGRLIPGAPVVWTSLDPTIAQVSTSGVVTPVSVGATEVVASLDALADTAIIVVPSTPTTLDVTPDPVTLDSVGATVQLAAQVRNQFDEVLAGEPVTWSSADPAIATVTAAGLVTAVSGGVTTIQAQAAGLTTDVLITVDGGPPLPGFTWTNLSGGDWSDPANWDRGAVPGPADTAFIRLDGSYTVTVNNSQAVAVLEVGSTSGRPRFEVAAGVFTVSDSAWFGPGTTAVLTSGRWAGAGDLVVSDSLLWGGGFHSGAGTTLVTAAGTLTLSGTGTKTLQGRALRLEGQGLVDGGTFDLSEAAQLTVAAGSVLDLGGASIVSSSTGAQVGRLVVDGTLRKPAALNASSVSARLVNNGLVSIGEGRLFVTSGQGGFEGSGDWDVGLDAVLRTAGTPAVAEIGAGGRVTGIGTWEVRASTDVLGSIEMEGGVDFGNPGIELFLSSPDTIRLASLQVGAGGTLRLAPGAAVRVNDSFGIGTGAGTIAGPGAVVLPAGTTGTVASAFDATIADGAELVVGGLLSWDQGGFILTNGARVLTRPGGTFRLPLDGTLQAQTGALGDPVIVNQGELVGENGTGTVTLQPGLDNAGTLTIGTATVAFSGPFAVGAGGLVQGVGTLDLSAADPVSVEGTIDPGLTAGAQADGLTIQGGLNLTAASTLSLQLGGTTGGTDADRLDIGGPLVAAGTLDLSGISGYQPAAGDTIEVLRYTSRTGAFDAVVGLDFAVTGGGEALDTLFEADRLLLVGPDPDTPPPSLTGVVAFVSDRDGSRELFVKDLETGAVVQLTDDVFSKSGPEWAPDGSRIAYSTGTVRLVNSDGSGLTTIGASGNAFGPSWSPDGTRIAYQDGADGDWDIFVTEADPPRTYTDVTLSTANEFYPAWSPDGARFAYTTSNTGAVVSVRASDAGDLQTHYPGGARYPRWSPDGSEIVFSEAVAGGWRIQVVTIATGAVREIVNDGTTNWFPTWSPDGQYIMYSKTPVFGTDDFDLYAIRSDGSGDQILIEASPDDDFDSDWTTAATLPSGSPTVTITSPSDGAAFSPGATINFTGSATDPEDGVIPDTGLAWSSSLDGALGTGGSLSLNTLSQGNHVITLTATDSEANTGSASIDVSVSPTADLSVTMTVTPDPVNVGDTLTHTVTVSNAGPDPVNEVELSLLVEGDVLFAFVNELGCGNFFNDNPPQKLFRCQLGTLAAGVDTTLALRVLPQAQETLTSTADISSFTGATDPDAGDRVFSETTTVQGPPSGSVDLRGGIGAYGFGASFASSYQVGDTVRMFYSVNNLSGPDDEPNPVVTVSVTGIDLNALPTFPAYCDTVTLAAPAGFRWTCATRPLGPFTGSEIDTLYFVPRTAGTATLQFDITGDFTDTDLTNNSETETTSVTGPPSALTGAIVFSSERDGTRDVYIKDLDTGAITQVENDAGTSTWGELSPDGTRIAYSNFQFSDNQPIYIVNSDGSGNVVEVSTTFLGAYPFWAPSGGALHFTDQIGGILDIWAADPLDPTVRVNLTNFASNTENAYDPQVSPDGNFFVYGENNERIVRIQTNGTGRTVLYDAPNQLGSFRAESPDYSPDGTEVLFTTTTDILAVNVSTLAVRTVVAGDGTDIYLGPTWSPDGQTIMYTRLVGSDYQIWAAPADGSGTQTLVEAADGFDLVSDWVTGVPGVTN